MIAAFFLLRSQAAVRGVLPPKRAIMMYAVSIIIRLPDILV